VETRPASDEAPIPPADGLAFDELRPQRRGRVEPSEPTAGGPLRSAPAWRPPARAPIAYMKHRRQGGADVKWGIEHLRVTLRDDSGETVVIEQSKDGAIRCEQANGVAEEDRGRAGYANRREHGHGCRGRATRRCAGLRKARSPEPRAKRPRVADEPSNEKKKGARPRGTRGRPREKARLAGLDPDQGQPTPGASSPSRVGGQFKVLRSATSYGRCSTSASTRTGSRGRTPKLLGCFPIDAEHKARARGAGAP
jgi:hypothetical protein